MEMKEFSEEMKKQLEKEIGEDKRIYIHDRLRNNSIKQTVLMIKEQGNCLAPTIYLESFYDSYKRGTEINVLVKEIIENYENHKRHLVMNFDFIYDWESVKGLVAYKLINTKRNMELLEEIPHEDFLDMSKVFYLSLCHGAGSMLIYKKHCDVWGITEKELICTAEKNTPKMFSMSLKSMGTIQRELFINDFEQGLEEEPEDFHIYIFSNRNHRMGASVICYPDSLKMLADIFQSDFYVIPSSIHEIIILPILEGHDVENLKKTLKEINEMYIGKEEILSDHVYMYKREQNKLCIAE